MLNLLTFRPDRLLIPTKIEQNYYDDAYFADSVGKSFRRPDGSLEHWGYRNPDGEFLGAKQITEAWKEMFKPDKMLDVGAGRGVFTAYARDLGIDAFGFDYSEYAVNEGRYSRCRPAWIFTHDATKKWPINDKEFDLVVTLDFMEHIYEGEDLDFVLKEISRVSSKYIFLQIATVDGKREKGYSLKKGEPVPVELEAYAVAGHVNVRTEDYWLEKLESDDWMLRRDLRQWFMALVDPAIIQNWVMNTIIVLERLE